ncbi:MAG TPA: prepilin-type N-terminal cleavage/methylation domain-containing protein [Chthoniobacterales bacterium]|jgi:prepilin-type N-terminal cleavage/methylation domain-containing protein
MNSVFSISHLTPSPRRSSLHSRAAAFTLVEVLVATAVLAIFMSGMFAINTQAFQLLRSGQGVIAAESVTRDRMDVIRNMPFNSQSSPTMIATEVLGSTGNTFPLLSGLEVVVQVTAFPPPASPADDPKTVIVTRNASGTVTTTDAGDGTLSNASNYTIMATVTTTWSARGKTRTHEAYMISTRGGNSGRKD